MRQRLIALMAALILATLPGTTAFAGGVRLSGVGFSLSSLVADGFASGLGRTDVTVSLFATGIPVVTCVSPGGNEAPGQNPPRVSGNGSETLPGNDPIRKNGRSPFSVETNDPVLTGREGGCPNNRWTARIDFVFWTNATITVVDTNTGEELVRQDYTCVTSGTPPDFTDATVSCDEA